jgi:hypothetical protein
MDWKIYRRSKNNEISTIKPNLEIMANRKKRGNKRKRDKLKTSNPRGSKRGGRKSIVRGKNNYGDKYAPKKKKI